MKLTNSYRPSTWRDQVLPPAALKVTRDTTDPSTPDYRGQIGFAYLIDQPQNSYAYVDTGATQVPCTASAMGGNIDVKCQTQAAGQLVVSENLWSGWVVARDGAEATLGQGPRLTTAAPVGNHVYSFRYRPWDVALGVLLTLVDLVWLVQLCWSPSGHWSQLLPARAQ